MYVLLTFLFCALVLGSKLIGPLSIRVYATIFLIGYLLLKKKRGNNIHYLKSYPITAYICFLLYLLIVKFFSQEFVSNVDELSIFFKNILAFYFVGIIGYVGINYLLITKRDARNLVLFLTVLALANTFISYLQYKGNPLGVGFAIVLTSDPGEYVKKIQENLDRVSDLNLALPGIFGHGVINGYYEACFAMISLYYFFINQGINKFVAIVTFLLLLYGSFIIQERSPMGLLLIFSMFAFWKYDRKNFTIIALIGVIVVIVALPTITAMLASDDMGRYAKMFELGSKREHLIDNALLFISDHLLLGGEIHYGKIYGLVPHNFALHAFIVGGLVGAIFVFYLFCYIFKDIYYTMKWAKNLQLSYFFASALSIYLLNGFFHTSSLLTGDIMIWVLYAAMLRCRQLKV